MTSCRFDQSATVQRIGAEVQAKADRSVNFVYVFSNAIVYHVKFLQRMFLPKPMKIVLLYSPKNLKKIAEEFACGDSPLERLPFKIEKLFCWCLKFVQWFIDERRFRKVSGFKIRDYQAFELENLKFAKSANFLGRYSRSPESDSDSVFWRN